MKNWVSFLMRSYRITFLLIVLALGLGVFGFLKMGKAEFPETNIRMGIVAAVYPGATSEEVEQQVAKPLERYLFTFDEVNRDKTITTSSNGLCIVQVKLQDSVNEFDVVWSKIKHGLNLFKPTGLPSGVVALAVNDNFGGTSALLVAIESDSRSLRELKEYTDELADRMRRIKSMTNVKIYGALPEQISISIDQSRLAAYGVGKMMLIQALQNAGFTTMAGSVSGMDKDVPIHVKQNISSEEDIENLIVYTDLNNNVVHLKDVAEVKREYDTTQSYIEYNEHPCVLLSLEMREGNNIVDYGKEVHDVIDDFQANVLPDDVTVSAITDQSKVVKDSVNDFMLNLIEAMAIIIIVMLILFPWRTAVVAGITVPLSTFLSLGVMWMAGIPLNTVTLAGLILVLGMIVDNSIVVLDGYLDFMRRGMERWDAAAKSAQYYFMPMFLATLCISVIFFPFLFVLTGLYNDFVYWLPWTVFINLMVSLVVAVLVIPILEYWLIREAPAEGGGKKFDITAYVQNIYIKVLDWTFEHPKLTIWGAVGLVVACCAAFVPMLKVRVMPVADRNQFAVEVSLPEGKGLRETQEVIDSLTVALHKEKDVVSVTSFVGCASPRFHNSYAPKFGGRNYAQLIVNTESNQATERILDKYEPLYSDRFPNAHMKFRQLDYQNFDAVELRFFGENEDSLRIVADRVMEQMRKNPKLLNVRSNWEDTRPIVEVELDPVASGQQGITRTLAQLQLALSTGNVRIGQIWEKGYEVPLVLKDVTRGNLNIDDIGDLYVTTANKKAMPLRQIADTKAEWSSTKIIHRGGERCLTVTSDIKRGIIPMPVHKDLRKMMEGISIPKGVRFQTGGEPENSKEMAWDVVAGLLIAIIIVFFFVLFNFKKYKMAFTCLGAILLIMPGTLIGLVIMDRPIGLTCIFGIVALIGMLMRNEILIFEHANDKVKEGLSVRDAAYDAGCRRMVPIFLTTATTAVGVIPMIIAATSFWMPVGVSIFAGGIGQLILVVTVLPVLYWKLNEKKETK